MKICGCLSTLTTRPGSPGSPLSPWFPEGPWAQNKYFIDYEHEQTDDKKQTFDVKTHCVTLRTWRTLHLTVLPPLSLHKQRRNKAAPSDICPQHPTLRCSTFAPNSLFMNGKSLHRLLPAMIQFHINEAGVDSRVLEEFIKQ